MTPVQALQKALAAEHAAVHLYGLLGAQSSKSQQPVLFARLEQAYEDHRAARDRLTVLVSAKGADPGGREGGLRGPGTDVHSRADRGGRPHDRAPGDADVRRARRQHSGWRPAMGDRGARRCRRARGRLRGPAEPLPRAAADYSSPAAAGEGGTERLALATHDLAHGRPARYAVDRAREVERLLHLPQLLVAVRREQLGRTTCGDPADRHDRLRRQLGVDVQDAVDPQLAAPAGMGPGNIDTPVATKTSSSTLVPFRWVCGPMSTASPITSGWSARPGAARAPSPGRRSRSPPDRGRPSVRRRRAPWTGPDRDVAGHHGRGSHPGVGMCLRHAPRLGGEPPTRQSDSRISGISASSCATASGSPSEWPFCSTGISLCGMWIAFMPAFCAPQMSSYSRSPT